MPNKGIAVNQDSKLMGLAPRSIITPVGVFPAIDINSHMLGWAGSLTVFVDGKPTMTNLAKVTADAFALPFVGMFGNTPPVPIGILTATGSPGMMPNHYMSAVSVWSSNGGNQVCTGSGNFQDGISCPNAMVVGFSSVLVKD